MRIPVELFGKLKKAGNLLLIVSVFSYFSQEILINSLNFLQLRKENSDAATKTNDSGMV